MKSPILTDEARYLGMGVKDPYRLQAGSLERASGTELIEPALIRLLTTPVGSREFNPDYGCRIQELLFEPNDDVLENLAYGYIKEAIDRWEKRVRLSDLQVTSKGDFGEGKNFIITYLNLITRQSEIMVFPFYTKINN